MVDPNLIDWTKVPWYVAITFMIFTALLAYIEKRQTSRDNMQTKILEQAAERQNQLDKYTKGMIDDLQEDLNRLRDDLNLEKKRNISTEAEMKTLRKENSDLKTLVEELRKENHDLKIELTLMKKEREKDA